MRLGDEHPSCLYKGRPRVAGFSTVIMHEASLIARLSERKLELISENEVSLSLNDRSRTASGSQRLDSLLYGLFIMARHSPYS
jgi:hypothetical protein